MQTDDRELTGFSHWSKIGTQGKKRIDKSCEPVSLLIPRGNSYAAATGPVLGLSSASIWEMGGMRKHELNSITTLGFLGQDVNLVCCFPSPSEEVKDNRVLLTNIATDRVLIPTVNVAVHQFSVQVPCLQWREGRKGGRGGQWKHRAPREEATGLRFCECRGRWVG